MSFLSFKRLCCLGLCALIFGIARSSTAGLSMQSIESEWLGGRPPYYRNFAKKAPPSGAKVAWLPVTADQRLLKALGGRLADLQPIVDAMNAHLAAQAWAVPIPAIGDDLGKAPDVYVGSARSEDARAFFGFPDTEDGQDPYDPDDKNAEPRMMMGLAHPAKKWRKSLEPALAAASADYAVFMTVGVAEYWIRQKDWKGSKEIELGTGYSVPLEWMSALDRPVYVLQVTGVLLDREGKVLRAGAEGFYARKTPFLISVLGVSAPITKDDVEHVLTAERRNDLPGAPLTWQIALQNLLGQLQVPGVSLEH